MGRSGYRAGSLSPGNLLAKKLNKDEFIAYQASERSGVLNVKVAGERVLISGKAATVLEGELLI